MNKNSRKIIATYTETKGRKHDLMVLKESKVRLSKETKAGVDSGYQGLQHEHGNTALPIKSSKHHPLTAADKKANREHARERILIEN